MSIQSVNRQLEQLRSAFAAGYSGVPPLRSALGVGVGAGTSPAWPIVLQGEGSPWREYAYPVEGDNGLPSLRICWFGDAPGIDFRRPWKRWCELSSNAFRCVRFLRNDASFVTPELPENWLTEVHRLAWSSDNPAFTAGRYRYLVLPDSADTVMRVVYAEVMDTDPEIVNGPIFDGVLPAQRVAGTLPAFPHRFVSILLPDVWQASMWAIDALLSPMREAADEGQGRRREPAASGPGRPKGMVSLSPNQMAVYRHIQSKHRPGSGPAKLLPELKDDGQLTKLLKQAGMTLDQRLIRNALKHGRDRSRQEQ